MKNEKDYRLSKLAFCIGLTIAASTAVAEEKTEEAVELESVTVEGDVQDTMGLMPTAPVDSVFGFGKSLLETPRSATSISAETIDAYGISDIDDLVVLSPGAFTQSFFGVAGSLDVRGTPGETYFRGIRRLDNPGNYPTPIGASDRVDIVRGPASPIHGPAKIGGYLNFVPKSARAETGQYLEEATGKISMTRGTWDKNVLTAEVGGPATVMDKTLGYYVYAETENSGSYYDNTATDQNVYQASFNMDLTDKSRIEFGGMYHEYDGNQVAGWNRLTQDLIDNGTYITGTAQSADTNGDGRISHQEYGAVAGGAGTDFFTVGQGSLSDADIPADYALQNVGTAQLDGSSVLVAPEDLLENDVLTLYFDYIYEMDSGVTVTNKFFYESYENLNENAYGFSQFHDTWVIEDQLVFAYEYEADGFTTNMQFSPSIRHTDFEHADDYSNEFFDRRDLTGPSTALDKRVLATTIDDDYTEYYYGEYTNIGVAFMADTTFDFGLSILAGVRQDFLDIESNVPVDKLLCPIIDDNGNYQSLSANYFGLGCSDAIENASDSKSGTSWNVSISQTTPWGVVPYFTMSEQSTIIAGQGAEVSTSSIEEDTYFDTSELIELGVKGQLFEDRLYFALSGYEMKRTDSNAQAIVTNQTSETTGLEFELRFLATEKLSLTAAFSSIEVVNLNTEENGARFSFMGAEDLTNVSDPSLIYGGQIVGVVFSDEKDGANKAGIPEMSYSMSAMYDFQNGFTTYASLFHADSTPSGHSRSVTLPSYNLINAGVSYTKGAWSANLVGKNLTDEEYFRSNFPDLFGSTIVLPELPRHFVASASYSF